MSSAHFSRRSFTSLCLLSVGLIGTAPCLWASPSIVGTAPYAFIKACTKVFGLSAEDQSRIDFPFIRSTALEELGQTDVLNFEKGIISDNSLNTLTSLIMLGQFNKSDQLDPDEWMHARVNALIWKNMKCSPRGIPKGTQWWIVPESDNHG
ncbi:hypothetical protein [Endozoicomonas numazuensis]|uniref:Uncharacterized protein n=1 Tax=Endozoicomonas numazuensis TaxID=1137799 RepID=A0A081NDJ7_9GAMM|nr:hypothetical protein [Endozoicomonas numazuensis]KEQ16520.1 hypothetical protein GZ78_21975 [Endozoicomonas numazuensis]